MRIRGERTRAASAVSTDRCGSEWARPVSSPHSGSVSPACPQRAGLPLTEDLVR